MNYTTDIKLELDGTKYYCKFLPWDTQFFGIKSFMLDVSKSKFKASEKTKAILRKVLRNSFVTIKLDNNCDKKLIDFLQSLGFRYIDTEILLKYAPDYLLDGRTKSPIGNPKEYHDQIKIERVVKNINLPYKELGALFRYSRFHNDSRISEKKADLLWVEYIKNFKPSLRKYMFVAKFKGRVVGAILVNGIKSKGDIRLFFVAVNKRFRCLGIGSRLIKNVVEYFDGCDIFTGTQAKNIRALNFYIRNGFSDIVNSKIILHRWGKSRIKLII